MLGWNLYLFIHTVINRCYRNTNSYLGWQLVSPNFMQTWRKLYPKKMKDCNALEKRPKSILFKSYILRWSALGPFLNDLHGSLGKEVLGLHFLQQWQNHCQILPSQNLEHRKKKKRSFMRNIFLGVKVISWEGKERFFELTKFLLVVRISIVTTEQLVFCLILCKAPTVQKHPQIICLLFNTNLHILLLESWKVKGRMFVPFLAVSTLLSPLFLGGGICSKSNMSISSPESNSPWDTIIVFFKKTIFLE